MSRDDAIKDAIDVARWAADALAPVVEYAAETRHVALGGSGREAILNDMLTAAIRVCGADGEVSPSEAETFREITRQLIPNSPFNSRTVDQVGPLIYQYRFAGEKYSPSGTASYPSMACLRSHDQREGTVYADQLATAIFRVAYLLARASRGISAKEGRELRSISPADFAKLTAEDFKDPDAEPIVPSMLTPPVPAAPPRRPPPPPVDPPRTLRDAPSAAPATPASPARPAVDKPLESLLEELDGLVGMASIKQAVREQANLLRVQEMRRRKGLKISDSSLHSVYVGRPGTGKTTVARLVAQIYRALGVLAKGHLVETDRAGLVAAYLGQTALKTAEVVEQARGGVLFIDEAYALAGDPGSGHDLYGREAIGTLLKRMEDLRDEIVVIVAGYPDEMHRFLDMNPGLASRFPRTFDFPDYAAPDLVEITDRYCRAQDYELTEDARARVLELYAHACANADAAFGNARYARNVFEAAVRRQASRVVEMRFAGKSDLMRLTAEDFSGDAS